jgi:F-type H+-transporting ATPase subunit b
LARQVSRLAQREVFAIARKALADLASASLEERIGEVFTRRLRNMDAGLKASLATALHDSADPALLRSSFELPAEERATIQNALNETFSAEVRLRFVTAPDAVCGIELTANGQKLAWSIGDYLETLEQQLGALVDAESAAAPDKSVATAVPAGPAPVTATVASPAPAAPRKVARAAAPAVAPDASVTPAAATAVAPAGPAPVVAAAAPPAAPAVAPVTSVVSTAPVTPAVPVPAAPVPAASAAVAS